MDYLAADFINVFLLVFGLLLVLAGIFTVYFGAGKSRKLGAGILLGGFITLGLMYWLFSSGYTDPLGGMSDLWNYIKGPLVTLLAGLTGAVVAVVVFIGVITKA